MGKKNKTGTAATDNAEPASEAAEEKPEDPPVVVKLKEIDDRYLAIEREFEKEMAELQQKYNEKQAPLLEERKQVLSDPSGAEGEAALRGTPALQGFWLQAMKNLPAIGDQIEEHDEQVLEYLSDIQKKYLDPENIQKGFSLTFHFVENPFFTNETIWKEYHLKEVSPYTGEVDTTEIKVSEISWKPGKNVTVETIKKKAKGGGAKKKNKSKEKEEPRDSFFRNFFRNLKPEMPVPPDINMEEAMQQLGEDSSIEDDEEMMSLLMDNDYEIGCSVRDQLIPFAVRWYTGEAQPDDGDDDDDLGGLDEDDEEEDDEEDDDDDDDEEEDSPAPRKKPVPKKRGSDEKKKGAAAAAGGKKQEECKQQ